MMMMMMETLMLTSIINSVSLSHYNEMSRNPREGKFRNRNQEITNLRLLLISGVWGGRAGKVIGGVGFHS